MSTPCIGIDLGTTFSAVAIVTPEGTPDILPNREGERITPSAVLFDEDGPIVGTLAKRAAATNPVNVVQFVKRQMGNAAWRFEPTHGGAYTAEEVSALILKRLKEDAQVALGHPVTHAVITVPAYFNDAQRKATQDAAVMAGLEPLRIINEPTAAALAYAYEAFRKHRAERDQRRTVMVYDLGGGTFDVTILRVEGANVEVLATGGDRNLGGFDWDNVLMVHLNDALQAAGGTDMLDDPVKTEALREQAELAKKVLSMREQTKVALPAGGSMAQIPVGRAEFETMTAHLIQRTQDVMESVLEDAKLTWTGIDAVLLVGGSTRMPAVRRMVERVAGRAPSAELHPDEVVAIGAAIMGELVQRQQAGASRAVPRLTAELSVVDVNAHSLGVVVWENARRRDRNSVILPRNSRIPARATEVYQTLTDRQREIEVRVTEGEEEDLGGNVRIIGQGTMAIPPYPSGAPIEISIGYDANGLVEVDVVDKTTGRPLGRMHIERRSNRTSAEVERMRLAIANASVG